MSDYMMNTSYNNPFFLNDTINPSMNRNYSSFSPSLNYNAGMLNNNYADMFNNNYSYNNPFFLNDTINPSMNMNSSSFSPLLNYNAGMLNNNYANMFNNKYSYSPTSNSSNQTNSDNTFGKKDNKKKDALTDKDCEALALYATRIKNAVGGIGTAVSASAGFAAFELAKPAVSARRTYKGIKYAKDALKNVNPEFYKQNFSLMDEARQTLVNTEKRLSKKRGLWKKALSNEQKDQLIQYREQLVKEMTEKNPNLSKISNANEQLKVASSVKNGCLVRQAKRLNPEIAVTQSEQSILSSAKKAVEVAGKSPIKKIGLNAFKTFKGFAIFEGIIDTIFKIIPAFRDGGAKSGFTQMVYSGGRIVATSGAYAIGHAAGAWAGAKLGASIGVAGGPWGAIIGGAVGIIVGCIASWGAEKGINCITKGTDEKDRLDALNTASDPNQVYANALEIEKAISQGKKVPPDTLAAYQKVLKSLNTTKLSVPEGLQSQVDMQA